MVLVASAGGVKYVGAAPMAYKDVVSVKAVRGVENVSVVPKAVGTFAFVNLVKSVVPTV